MYFREFGTPARIGRCNSKEDIEELVDKYNGKRNCYASVYVFDDLKDIEGKTDYDKKDINKCLKDVRKFIKKYCKPRNITPRIYLTGGKGFQMNIDFHSPLDFSDTIKRRVLREYLMHLKKEYKLTNEPTGVYCVGLTVDEVLKLSIEELYGMAMEPRDVPVRVKSKRALRDMVDFACDMFEVEHTVSNSVMYLYDKLKEASSYSSIGSTEERYIKAPRKCILELIENNIATNSSNHDENNVIALELLDAGKTDTEISFVFSSIYDEPAGDYGWYNDDPSIPGKQIVNMRAKGLHRYNKRRLRDMGICNNDGCPCEWS